MGQDEDFERLHDAYAKAWGVRGSGMSDHTLSEELDSLEEEVFAGPGPDRDLILGLWERGVPPEALKGELVRSLPGLSGPAFAAWARGAVEVAGYLLPEGQRGDAQDLPGDLPEDS